jgi:hypothetical protein
LKGHVEQACGIRLRSTVEPVYGVFVNKHGKVAG